MILEKLHWPVIVIINPTNLHITILSVSLHCVGEVQSNQITIIHPSRQVINMDFLSSEPNVLHIFIDILSNYL